MGRGRHEPLLRFAHVITGIAWIGASFYFVFLDLSLKVPTDPVLKEKGVDGELWAGRGNFQVCMSATRKDVPVDDEWRQIKYAVYSSPPMGCLIRSPYSARVSGYTMLLVMVPSYLCLR